MFSCSWRIWTSWRAPRGGPPCHGEAWPGSRSGWSGHSRRTSLAGWWRCGESSSPGSPFSSRQRTDRWRVTSRRRAPSCSSTRCPPAWGGRGNHTNSGGCPTARACPTGTRRRMSASLSRRGTSSQSHRTWPLCQEHRPSSSVSASARPKQRYIYWWLIGVNKLIAWPESLSSRTARRPWAAPGDWVASSQCRQPLGGRYQWEACQLGPGGQVWRPGVWTLTSWSPSSAGSAAERGAVGRGGHWTGQTPRASPPRCCCWSSEAPWSCSRCGLGEARCLHSKTSQKPPSGLSPSSPLAVLISIFYIPPLSE